MTATLILTVMILPIMVAITASALASVPRVLARGLGGARRQPLAHDLARLAAHRAARDRRRPRCSRPRARSARRSCSRWSRGGRPFAANPLDGLTFLFEPVQPLAATIFKEFGGQPRRPVAHTIYAIGAVLLVSAALLSLAGWAAKQPLKRYGIGV